ncbi:hypothetical protein H0H93_013636 [Arthromyces matolae]|nr:hypothetical protein H0H93_013636 [Arthromyces matolae]
MPQKRKADQDAPEIPCKRTKLLSQPQRLIPAAAEPSPDQSTSTEKTRPNSRPQRKRQINKLVPPRPFPTVPTSVSATGPRSAHKEGKNLICVTRKTPLGAYLRRCKDAVLKDGYKTLYLNAMGAAVPHLLQLVVALPSILPFPPDEIKTEVTTGTVEVQDEVIPDDEDEDFTYETRGKSTLNVLFKIGDGEFDGDRSGAAKKKKGKHRPALTTGQAVKKNNKQKEQKTTPVVCRARSQTVTRISRMGAYPRKARPGSTKVLINTSA